MQRACERIWLYIKKITSIVVAVAIVVYVLLQFPGLSPEREIHFQAEVNQTLTTFQTKVDKQGFAEQLPKAQYLDLMQYWKDYKNATVSAGGNKELKKSINQKFKDKNSLYYGFLKPKGDKKATKINRGVRKLLSTQKRLRREIKQDKISLM